ncbi:MAG TPA: type IV secretory system conjugative DNA transfer family protein [Candidatus Eisenbergiella merdavium]|uniref:Type IV secretory system conjugative DNA transfer family protein n=1 Tax=Candidatus Eisenbergiella merdavium TaxID=2838551 RepID=A0A9D2ND11_9FIRM|nr:type IV secretory system conjugative DNA transfer family protein [Candidatus Eisenbergiella merdavium]
MPQPLNSRLRLLLACLPLPFLAAALLYAGGFISQLLYHYQIWAAAGGTPGDGTSPLPPSLAFGDCLRILGSFPYCLYSVFLAVGILIYLFILFYRMKWEHHGVQDKERNITYSNQGTYGTSGYMTDAERKQVLELTADLSHNNGILLGKLQGKAVLLPETTRLNRNVAVFGASGSMKSRAYARNAVFQSVKRGESLIITDPKSELYGDLCIYLKQNGYLVRVFNLIHPENSDSWNCLAEVSGMSADHTEDLSNIKDTEILAQLFCDVILKNTQTEKGNRFWDDSEMNLLKALVLYVALGFPPEGRNIGEVYKLLTLCTESEINGLFAMLPATHPSKAPYNLFLRASNDVRSGVITGLGTRLQVFQSTLIRQMTSHNEIDLTLPGRKKCAYFCITSDQDSTFDFLSSLFMSFIFIKLVRYADSYGESGKLPVPVHILADELANGGCTIADLTKKISTIRSRQLSISCIFQNLPQMQNRYPNNQWAEIIGNCDTQLFLGCTDDTTARYISDRSGDVSISVSSQSQHLNSIRLSDYTPEYRETRSTGRRKLMTPDEVLRLPLDQALIILRGQKILKVEKFDYTLHPESKKLISSRAIDHVPEWRKNKPFAESDPVEFESSSIIRDGSTRKKSKIVHTDKKSILS